MGTSQEMTVMFRTTLATTIALIGALAGQPALAHVVVGVRVFPVTLTFDDPGVGDEATLPQFIWQRDAGPQNRYDLQWEYDKTITPTTAIIYNHGYDWLQQSGSKTHSGLENVFITGKWQAYTNAEHEFVASFGVIREFGGGVGTQSIGGDTYGATSPTAYFGKGLGDLPIGLLRPLAITGEFSYNIPDRRLNSALANSGNPASVSGALSIQYSIPYLQSQVKDFGLPEFFGRLIPLVETTWYSPTQAPAGGFPSTWTVSPGVIYLGDTYQVGIEALIPMNRQTGHNVGVIVQVHLFFDDLFPRTLGKPITGWFR
jgi:hypothetical protein